MLPTSKIIELYDLQDFDTLSSHIKLLSSYSGTKSQQVLKYAIYKSDIELFKHTFTTDNFYDGIIAGICERPLLYPHFEYVLSTDPELCDYLEKIINRNHRYNYDYTFLKILMKHIKINNTILGMIFYNNLYKNNIDVLSDIIAYGYNDKFDIDHSLYGYKHEIKISTFIFLEEHNIDILSNINKIGTLYCYRNNIDGIIFCLNRGADINLLFKLIGQFTNTETIKFLIDNGADINCIPIENIFDMTDETSIALLVDFGVDISNNLDKLILYAIYNNCPKLVTYYINLGIDIHVHNELFLFFAVDMGNIKIVELLLDAGANIYARNNSILLYNGEELDNEISLVMEDDCSFENDTFENSLKMFEYLLKRGAIITNPQNIHDYYVTSMHEKLNEIVLTYFLEAGLDLNILPDNDKSILFDAIYACNINTIALLLKYNINLGDNYYLIEFAMKNSKIKITQMLLNVILITPEIIKLLEELDLDKKLIY